ncbi:MULTISPECIES: ESX secretion-associated protein EspG [Mycobacterium]|uniref:ESX secretion-associated protein EspG n=1 Tax=Mycobacterium kiyosense TaxID=2871094 RepID=A0A9P3Q4Z9_9MYCO|nr:MULTISPECIES: ESX secretion-associated protein EspG [Mycobacterium]BDB40896.1 hypothetical protein IWGMT90018_13420 [Mycobacterium kiyosense]BDE12692.1 hypothetical protein MKCMC460_15520 [Mycobacterium sp. 20KCMC460]GLB82633.1 hypothetical protein SRL2020028_18890 [Mycobacterium kiyosense]GLB87861.1 hypothetical protein SRL2020130_06780 [Mycobacterium kiyosense]GLB94018.1 hypothetical protein SRL2020226_07940 [Mycobacterium kiyosense]
MPAVSREHIGGIDISDLARICDVLGLDGLPYPFAETGRPGLQVSNPPEPHRFSDRPADGDLRGFHRWIQAYTRADIWVECRVLYRATEAGDIPDTRISALRADQLGFCAVQRPDLDVVDVYELAPYDLGAAIANSVPLIGPGRHSQITIPKYVDYFADSTTADADTADDDYTFSVLEPVTSRSATVTVPDAGVAAVGTIQSHWEPARSWGMDWAKSLVAWVQISDDGDYVYVPDFSHAVPATERKLADRIDDLIAADVAVLRRRRGIT